MSKPPTDQSFDGLTDKFAKNIYATAKGKLRLAVLERDLAPLFTSKKTLTYSMLAVVSDSYRSTLPVMAIRLPTRTLLRIW